MRDAKIVLLMLLAVAFSAGLAIVGLAEAQGAESSRTLAALERVPVHTSDRDEPEDERRERLALIAEAIDGATLSLDERAWLIMTARYESNLARYVAEDHDRCRLGQGGVCDSGRAFGLWQLHGTQRELTLSEQAAKALRLFRSAASRCHRSGHEYWRGGISGYATGLSCSWPDAEMRLKTLRAVRSKL